MLYHLSAFDFLLIISHKQHSPSWLCKHECRLEGPLQLTGQVDRKRTTFHLFHYVSSAPAVGECLWALEIPILTQSPKPWYEEWAFGK
jgi:hypothetical protein